MGTTSILAFLNENTGAIQAVSTVVLVAITALSTWFTLKMVRVMHKQITPDIKLDNVLLGSSLMTEWFLERIKTNGGAGHYISFKLAFDVRNSGAGSGSLDKPLLSIVFKGEKGTNTYSIGPRTKSYSSHQVQGGNSSMSTYETSVTDLGGTIYLTGGSSQNIELEYQLNVDDYPTLSDDLKNKLESLEASIIYKDNLGRLHRDRIDKIHLEEEIGRD